MKKLFYTVLASAGFLFPSCNLFDDPAEKTSKFWQNEISMNPYMADKKDNLIGRLNDTHFVWISQERNNQDFIEIDIKNEGAFLNNEDDTVAHVEWKETFIDYNVRTAYMDNDRTIL